LPGRSPASGGFRSRIFNAGLFKKRGEAEREKLSKSISSGKRYRKRPGPYRTGGVIFIRARKSVSGRWIFFQTGWPRGFSNWGLTIRSTPLAPLKMRSNPTTRQEVRGILGNENK